LILISRLKTVLRRPLPRCAERSAPRFLQIPLPLMADGGRCYTVVLPSCLPLPRSTSDRTQFG
jgi:hypothetical protein